MTAQRREERLQNVPAAVTAVSGVTLEKLNLSNSTELQKIAPGLHIDRNFYIAQPTVRGIGSRSLSPGEESTVPLFIDGVYQSFPPASVFQLSGIDRIEVLKGPQGALYGRNSTGGAINVITRTPQAGARGDLDVSYGGFHEFLGKGYIEGGTDTLAASLSGVYDKDDGYLHDLITKSSYGAEKSISLRGKIVWRPTSDLQVNLVGSHDYQRSFLVGANAPLNGNTVGVRVTPQPIIATGRYDVALGQPSSFMTRQDSVALTAKWNLGGVTLNGVSSYTNFGYSLANFTNAAVQIPQIYKGDDHIFGRANYNELYLSSNNSSALNWMIGAVYYHVTTGYSFLHIWQQNVATGAGTLTTNNNFVDDDSVAGYAQATYNFTSKLSLTASGRYTTETSSLHVRNFRSGADNNYNDPYAPVAAVNADAQRTWHAFTPTVDLQYKFSDHANVYAKFAEGFKSGVFSPGGASTTAANPEHIRQYEIGLKTEPTRWLRINLAAYYTKYDDIQVQARDPVTNLAVLQNASRATIKGGEAEIIANPIHGLTLMAGLAITDAHYDQFPGAQVNIPISTGDAANPTACTINPGTLIGGNRTVFCNLGGNRLLRAPLVTANLGGTYTMELDSGAHLEFDGNLLYQSHYYWDTLNRIREPSQILVDGEIAFTPARSKLTFSIWVKNLTNQYYHQSVSTTALGDTEIPGPPRTYGVRLRAHF